MFDKHHLDNKAILFCKILKNVAESPEQLPNGTTDRKVAAAFYFDSIKWPELKTRAIIEVILEENPSCDLLHFISSVLIHENPKIVDLSNDDRMWKTIEILDNAINSAMESILGNNFHEKPLS